MPTHTPRGLLPWIILCCGAFPWVVVPALGFIVANTVPTALTPVLFIAGTVGLVCAAFAALARRPSAGATLVPRPQRVGNALGLVYLAILVAGLVIGAVGGLLSPWLYELAS
jgi:hypothetical protein